MNPLYSVVVEMKDSLRVVFVCRCDSLISTFVVVIESVNGTETGV